MPEYYPQFFTATILEWNPLLKQDKYKRIILNSLYFLVKHRRIKLYGFTIMINHMHLVWHIQPAYRREDVQRDFLKYTAQHITADLKTHHPALLPDFYVGAKDRKYQIWERNPLSIDLRKRKVMYQKLNYMHSNPVKAGICNYAQDYPWSSASFYMTGVDNFGFLTHVMD
jgi:REP element-mobilizing transposase RayT